ncbi:hypothetical protein Trydic_g20474 [Trypoxylus dichotomus]
MLVPDVPSLARAYPKRNVTPRSTSRKSRSADYNTLLLVGAFLANHRHRPDAGVRYTAAYGALQELESARSALVYEERQLECIAKPLGPLHIK